MLCHVLQHTAYRLFSGRACFSQKILIYCHCHYFRLRARNAAVTYAIKMNTMHPYPPDGAYATQEFEYNTSYETPDFNKENYIYYLKHQSQNQSPTTPPGGDDNGYYSDHTYESPQCGHLHKDDSSGEQINQLGANNAAKKPHIPDGAHTKTCEVPSSPAHFTFPRSDKETYTELCHGINTVWIRETSYWVDTGDAIHVSLAWLYILG